MISLAVDTSTAACAVALRLGSGETLVNSPAPARMFEHPAHTTELLPAIAELLAAAGIDFSDLDLVAVGVGPGAFTGLRIGVSTARALATANQLPLTAVSSLAALEAAAEHDGPILPVIDARRNEYFFRADDVDQVATPEQLLVVASAQGGPLAVGDGAIKFRDQLVNAGAAVPNADDPQHVVSAAAILDLAAELESTAVDLVVPNYIRAPDAKVSARESWLVGSSKP